MNYLSQLLKKNQTLESIDLSINKIGENGANFLSESIKYNSSLTEIYMSCNRINLEGAKMILESLKLNSTLIKLLILNNKFHSNYIFHQFEFYTKCNESWNTSLHIDLTCSFKSSVYTWLLVAKFFERKLVFRIPKFILFEIIKKIDRKSFSPLHNENKRKRNF